MFHAIVGGNANKKMVSPSVHMIDLDPYSFD
jgi:hypothetical protein